MTQKAGQKCTAIRRVLVPAAVADRVRDDLVDRLAAITVGNPAAEGVRMGPLATAAQLDDVRDGIVAARPRRPPRVRPGRGRRRWARPRARASSSRRCSSRWSRGPRRPRCTRARCSAPWPPSCPTRARPARRRSSWPAARAASSRRSTPRTLRSPPKWSWAWRRTTGRVFLGSAKIAEQSPGPGTVLPLLVHGGPGRAGGGEELGGAARPRVLPAARGPRGLAAHDREDRRLDPRRRTRARSSLRSPEAGGVHLRARGALPLEG